MREKSCAIISAKLYIELKYPQKNINISQKCPERGFCNIKI